MSIYFFDSSAIVKRYVPETGSAWVQSLTDPAIGNLLYLVRITGAEVVSAVTRRQKRGQITAADAASSLAAFRRDFTLGFLTVEVLPPLVESAMDLAERHGLRGYDSVQLAAALALRDLCLASGLPAPIFIAADAELNAAATAEGLVVDNPNSH